MATTDIQFGQQTITVPTGATVGGYVREQSNADGSTSLLGPEGSAISTLGNAITVGPGGQYTDIQTAIDSITDNLPVNYSTGTVAVTNGSATIAFSSAPAADKVVAGRDLFSIDGSRYYRIKNGPTTAGGATFNLYEVYQGTTNATASFGIYKPNPRTVLLLPGVYDYTGTLARNILLKPYVGITGVDRDSCIIRRNTQNSSPDTTPVIGLTHGSWLDNLTLDAVDGHFLFYRMGLTAYATTQTQAMKGSRWFLRNVALRNADPNGIDTGADYIGDSGNYYNEDEIVFDDCDFEYCWDGFTMSPLGGRLKLQFNRPKIIKIPTPLNKQSTGACFIRFANKCDVVMIDPYCNQKTYCSDETFANDGNGGAISNAVGFNGVAHVTNTGGATLTVINPTVEWDVGASYSRSAPFANMAGDASTAMNIVGGSIEIAGAGAAGAEVAGVLQIAAGTTTICGTRIESGKDGVKNNHASGVVNLQGGARIKGATNSLVNTAGTINQSANVSLAGVAASGVITSAET